MIAPGGLVFPRHGSIVCRSGYDRDDDIVWLAGDDVEFIGPALVIAIISPNVKYAGDSPLVCLLPFKNKLIFTRLSSVREVG